MAEAQRPELVRLYNEPERLAQLWLAYEEARKYEWPSVLVFNF